VKCYLATLVVSESDKVLRVKVFSVVDDEALREGFLAVEGAGLWRLKVVRCVWKENCA
jgi:hypothetical protein